MRFANKLIRTAVIAAILCAGIPEIPGHTASAYAGTADIAAASAPSAGEETSEEDIVYTVSGKKTVYGHYNEELSDEVTQLINSYRTKMGLKSLKVTCARSAAAGRQVLSSAYNYRSFSTINSAKGLRTATVTAMGPGSAEFLVNSLTMCSSTERKIVNGSYRYIGVSVFASAVPSGLIVSGAPETGYRYYAVISLGR